MGAADFPGRPSEVKRARGFVRRILGDGHPAAEDVELLASELVTNAIQYTRSGRPHCNTTSRGSVSVAVLARDHVVRVEVADEGGSTTVPEVRHDVYADRGRGLFLVKQLSANWGMYPNALGTTLWFEVKTRLPGMGRAVAILG